MSIILNKSKKTISLFSNLNSNLKKDEIILNDLFLENKIISSYYLISFFLKKKNIFCIQFKNNFIEIDFESKEILKLKEFKKIFWKKEILNIKLDEILKKQFNFYFFESSNKFNNYKIKILSNDFDFSFLKQLFLQNLSTYKLNEKIIHRLQIKISNSDLLLEKDHRKINKTLNFFCFNSLMGSALPIWLSNGEFVKNKIKTFIRKIEEKNNFLFVTTPILVNKKIYEISGHLDHYKDSMFPEIVDGLNSLMLRPMTCPQHCLIFLNKKRSYKELPLRISENALLFRYESSGSLTGLERVRQMELKDLHVFIQKDIEIIKKEIIKLFNMTIEVLKKFEIKIEKIYLSLHDEKNIEKYFLDSKLWNETETILKKILIDMNVEFLSKKGEAAFYGPKIDFQIKSILGHDITVSTIQLDFLLSKNFNLKYKTKNKENKTPIIIHHGIFGTYERLISILLEQNNGWLPFWLSNKQVSILPINNNEEIVFYCKKIKEMLDSYEIRTKLFDFDNNLNKNIKFSWIEKIPFQIFIGEKELKKKIITFSYYKNPKKRLEMNIFEFIKECKVKL